MLPTLPYLQEASSGTGPCFGVNQAAFNSACHTQHLVLCWQKQAQSFGIANFFRHASPWRNVWTFCGTTSHCLLHRSLGNLLADAYPRKLATPPVKIVVSNSCCDFHMSRCMCDRHSAASQRKICRLAHKSTDSNFPGSVGSTRGRCIQKEAQMISHCTLASLAYHQS